MDLYIWIMRRLDFDVSDTGYFLYCDADRFTEKNFLGESDANMRFKMTILPYTSNQSWIEETLLKIRKILVSKKSPQHNPDCEYGQFLGSVREFQ